MIEAPWSQDIVDRLNAQQKANVFHPYTCGNCREDLVATENGWICSSPVCGYTQNWAHNPLTIEDIIGWRNALEEMIADAIEAGKESTE